MKFVRDNDTPQGIWLLVVTEQYDDILPNAPELKDKIYAQVDEVNKFKKEFISTMAYAKDVFVNDTHKNRKNYAAWVNEQVPSVMRPWYFNACEGEPEEIFKKLFDKMATSKKGYEDIYLPIKNVLNLK